MEYKLKPLADGRFSIKVAEKTYVLPRLSGDWPDDEAAVRYLAKSGAYKKEGCVFKTRNGKWWGFLPEGEEPAGIIFLEEPVSLSVVNYPAHPIYECGTIESFNILLGGLMINAPYVGEYVDYRECDKEAQLLRRQFPETGYVCRASHNKPNEYIYYLPEGMTWSAGGYKDARDVYIVAI